MVNEPLDWIDSPAEMVLGLDWLSRESTTYALNPAVRVLIFSEMSFESRQGLARDNGGRASVAGLGHFKEDTFFTILGREEERLRADDPMRAVIDRAFAIREMTDEQLEALPFSDDEHRDARNYDEAALVGIYGVVRDEAAQITRDGDLAYMHHAIPQEALYQGHMLGGPSSRLLLSVAPETLVADLPLGCSVRRDNIANLAQRDLIIRNQGPIFAGTVGEATEMLGDMAFDRHGIAVGMHYRLSEDGMNLLPADQYTAAVGMVAWERLRHFHDGESDRPYAANDVIMRYDGIRAELEAYVGMDPARVLVESGLLRDEGFRAEYGIRGTGYAAAQEYLEQFGTPVATAENPHGLHTVLDNPLHCMDPALLDPHSGEVAALVEEEIRDLTGSNAYHVMMEAGDAAYGRPFDEVFFESNLPPLTEEITARLEALAGHLGQDPSAVAGMVQGVVAQEVADTIAARRDGTLEIQPPPALPSSLTPAVAPEPASPGMMASAFSAAMGWLEEAAASGREQVEASRIAAGMTVTAPEPEPEAPPALSTLAPSRSLRPLARPEGLGEGPAQDAVDAAVSQALEYEQEAPSSSAPLTSPHPVARPAHLSAAAGRT